MSALETLRGEALALIEKLADGSRDDAARDALLDALLEEQSRSVRAYGRLAKDREPGHGWPAVPTDVFRYLRVASHAPTEDRRVFQTSGTTQGTRGVHALRDLRTYDRAAEAAARLYLFPDHPRMRLLMLAPHESEAPHSSLSYMLSRFAEWFGQGEAIWAWHRNRLDRDRYVSVLSESERSGEPLAVLGTSFALVHADEALEGRRFALPAGSRMMQTGGFKGRSREIDPQTMRAMLSERYGVGEASIVAEYGMTELSSQLYETSLRDLVLGDSAAGATAGRRLWVPGWVRTTAVDSETLEPLADGEPGLLRIDDLANIDSVAAIQTSDLAITYGASIELLGRSPGAVSRGCSLAIEEALSR